MSKIKAGKTYPTRDGRTVRILATDFKHDYSVVGAILREDGTEVVQFFTANGNYYRHIENHNLDIIIPPERKSRWINWYRSYFTNSGGIEYASREEADRFANKYRTHVIQIITENGEPVDVKIHKVER